MQLARLDDPTPGERVAVERLFQQQRAFGAEGRLEIGGGAHDRQDGNEHKTAEAGRQRFHGRSTPRRLRLGLDRPASGWTAIISTGSPSYFHNFPGGSSGI